VIRRRLVVAPGGGAVTLERVEVPPAQPDAIVLAPKLVGICGTDLDIIAGARGDRARVFGHEAVVRTASGLQIVNPVDSRDQDRIIGHSEEGMLQDRVEVAASRLSGGLLVPIEPGVDPLLAVLSEPLGAAVYSVELLTEPGVPDRLLILGAGPMGLLTAVAARLFGVPDVVVVDRCEARLAYAAEHGLAARHRDARPDDAPDAVAVCVGRDHRLEALWYAAEVAAAGGRIGLTTGFAAGETVCGVDLADVRRANVRGVPWPGHHRPVVTDTGKPLSLTGHRGTASRHLRSAMALLRDHPETFRPLITDIVGLDAAPDLLAAVLRERQRPDSAPYRKVVVRVG
jgi:2-epi-valiolone-7-phosphate 1-reductase